MSRLQGLAPPALGPQGQRAPQWGSACPVVSLRIGPSKELGAPLCLPRSTCPQGQGRGGTDRDTLPWGAGRSDWALSLPGLTSRPPRALALPHATRPNPVAACPGLLNEAEWPSEGTRPDEATSTQPPARGLLALGILGQEGGILMCPAAKLCTRPRRSSRCERGWQVPVASPACAPRLAGGGLWACTGLQDMSAP